MRRLAFLILRWTGVPFLLREFVQRNRVTILCYHDPEPKIADLHIRKLQHLYNIIPLSAYVNARRSRTVAALPKKALVITFDDGHKGNYGLLPVLKKHQVPVTIFLCSGIIGTQRHYWWKACVDHNMVHSLKLVPDEARLAQLADCGFNEVNEYPERQSLSRAEINDLRAAVDFQAHSRLHPILPQCTDKRAWDEIAGCKLDLERDYGLRVFALAYPNGDYSERELEFAKRAGYACALTIDGGYNTSQTDLFRLKRVRLNDKADVNELIVKASGLWGIVESIRARSAYGYAHMRRVILVRRRISRTNAPKMQHRITLAQKGRDNDGG